MYQFADNLKSDRAFLFYRGSTALYAILRSMGVGKGDEVILQVFTCPDVPTPVVCVGATPIYADIDPNTFSIDPGKIEDKITARTKAIIVQHTFGIPAEMDPILAIAREHSLWVIEDACHALGSKYRGQEVGSFGDAAIYSFGWYKPLVLGLGGAAVVNNPELEPRLRETWNGFAVPSLAKWLTMSVQYAAYALLLDPKRFWAMKEIYRRLRDFKSGPRKGQIAPLFLGYSLRSMMNKSRENATQQLPLQPSSFAGSQRLVMEPSRTEALRKASVASRQIVPFQRERLFRKLDRWHEAVTHQAEVVSRYTRLFAQAGHAPLELGDHLEPVLYKYPMLFDQKREIFSQAKRKGIEMSDEFGSPLYPSERAANWRALGYEEGMCPISEGISDRVVALPTHREIQSKHVIETVAFLSSFR